MIEIVINGGAETAECNLGEQCKARLDLVKPTDGSAEFIEFHCFGKVPEKLVWKSFGQMSQIGSVRIIRVETKTTSRYAIAKLIWFRH